jgi:hypothetical protein
MNRIRLGESQPVSRTSALALSCAACLTVAVAPFVHGAQQHATADKPPATAASAQASQPAQDTDADKYEKFIPEVVSIKPSNPTIPGRWVGFSTGTTAVTSHNMTLMDVVRAAYSLGAVRGASSGAELDEF